MRVAGMVYDGSLIAAGGECGAFDWKIAERELFCKRFGSMGVQEIRKVLFAVYLSAQQPGSALADYEIGRKLGLTESQVKNLRVGANLLLDDDAKTMGVVRGALVDSFKRSLVSYQKDQNRIAVQVDDPIAFNFLSAALAKHDVFRDADARNGHIAVPVQHFGIMLEIVFPGFDEEKLSDKLAQLVPEYAEPGEVAAEFGAGGRVFGWLADHLGDIADATTVVCGVLEAVPMIVNMLPT